MSVPPDRASGVILNFVACSSTGIEKSGLRWSAIHLWSTERLSFRAIWTALERRRLEFAAFLHGDGLAASPAKFAAERTVGGVRLSRTTVANVCSTSSS